MVSTRASMSPADLREEERLFVVASTRASELIRALEPLKPDDRARVMAEVDARFCPLCRDMLAPGQRCYCAAGYDE
jgi:RNase P subunit RPR2